MFSGISEIMTTLVLSSDSCRAVTPLRPGAPLAEMTVPGCFGSKVLRILMSMPFSLAGATAGAYSTLAP